MTIKEKFCGSFIVKIVTFGDIIRPSPQKTSPRKPHNTHPLSQAKPRATPSTANKKSPVITKLQDPNALDLDLALPKTGCGFAPF